MSDHSVVVVVRTPVVTVVPPAHAVVISAGPAGPAGPVGPSGGSVVTKAAGENLSAGRAVVIVAGAAFYFQPSVAAHAGCVFGVTRTSATAPAAVEIQIGGVLLDAAFAFASDSPVFSGPAGELSSVPPVAGTVQQIGTAIAANTLFINQLTSLRRI